jgi:MoaA/NifB/PqqE/SkfB family radical SAM enzyme
MSDDTRLFCSKPFTWFEVSTKGANVQRKGDVYMCCPSWLDTSIGNLADQSVEEIWNGENAQKIRESILDGSFKYCDASKCAFLQTASGPVQPVEAVEDKTLKTVIAEGLTKLPYGPKEVICSYDSSCNLSCPSCRFEVFIEHESKEQILALEEKLRSEALKDATFLYITGSGDPFGSPYFRKWLQTMKKSEMPNLKEIRLHSNAQLWTPGLWNTIPEEIRELITSAEISVDAACAATYSVNRRGGDFDKLLRNFEFISSLLKNGPLKSVTISMVVQENNFQEMPDFVRLGQRFGFDVIYFSQLVNWGTFSSKDYANRAVHLPKHPKHSEFVELLQGEIFDQPEVHLGNLTEIRNSPTGKAEQPKIWAKAQKLLSQIGVK